MATIKGITKKGLELLVMPTHANNSGQITVFIYGKGLTHPASFNLSEFDNVLSYLAYELPHIKFWEE